MRVIIIGAGEVGFHIAKILSEEEIAVVVIDMDTDKLGRIGDELDAAVIEGEGGSPTILREAGAESADMLLAVTNSDETNMIACLMTKAMFNIPRKIARIRNPEYFNNAVLLSKENLDVNPAINPELESAKAIIRLLEIPYSSAVEDFEGGLIKVIGLKIPEGSKLVGKSLIDLRKTFESKFLIGIIQHDDRITIPSGSDKISENDIVYLPVPKEDVEKTMLSLFPRYSKPLRSIIIVGGGRIGYNVALAVEETGVMVKIIEKNGERCKFLSKKLKSAIILHGDGSDRMLLEEENIQDMDVFAAISNNEELNIMASLLAKRLGVKKIITIVNRTDYIPLAHSLGIEVVLSPRLITASSILRYVRHAGILSLTAIAEDMAEIIEAEVGKESTLRNVTIKDADLPGTTLIGAIIRNGEVIIPSGEDNIYEGDRLIFFTLREGIKEIEKIL